MGDLLQKSHIYSEMWITQIRSRKNKDPESGKILSEREVGDES